MSGTRKNRGFKQSKPKRGARPRAEEQTSLDSVGNRGDPKSKWRWWIVSDEGYEDGPYRSLAWAEHEAAYLKKHWKGYIAAPRIEKRSFSGEVVDRSRVPPPRSIMKGERKRGPKGSDPKASISLFVLRQPHLCHCNICDRPIRRKKWNRVELRPTGINRKIHMWPYCKSCFERHLSIVGYHLPTVPYVRPEKNCRHCERILAK